MSVTIHIVQKQMDYSKYLETRINHARSLIEGLNEEEKDEAVLLANINGVRNIIFEVLDYSVNHFHGYSGKCPNLYFPLIGLSQDIGCLTKDKRYINLKNEVGGNIEKYIGDSYKIIFDPKFDQCLLLLQSSTKHRNVDEILDKKPEINARIVGNEMKKDIYGGFDIGGFKMGGNVRMSGCVFSGPEGVTIVESLETVEVEGQSLLINAGNNNIRVLIKPFLIKCVECCKSVISLWKTYKI